MVQIHNESVHLLNGLLSKHFILQHYNLPSFSKLRLFSASWSAFLWYSVNRCCSMILSFSSKDTLASVFFLMFACEVEQIVNGLLKNNAKQSEKAVLEFHLFVQFLHDLFKLGMWCPGRNTNCGLSTTNCPKFFSWWSFDSMFKDILSFQFCWVINFVLCIAQVLNCGKWKN